MAVFRAIMFVAMAAAVTGDSVEVTPREAVRRVGDEVSILCKVAYRIDSCRMTVGQQSYILRPGGTEGNVVYQGNGLEAGECGAHIKNINDEWNGNVSCFLPPQTGSIELVGVMRLIIAKPPALPILETTNQPHYLLGDTFQAVCVVPNGRPPARINWFLEEDPLTEGLHRPNISEPDAQGLQTISQGVTRTLTAEDNAKRLVCQAEHVAWNSPQSAHKQLIVYYPPMGVESGPMITIFGLTLGAEGRLNVTVRANPLPLPVWTIGDQILHPRQTDNTGNVHVLDPINLGNGYYNCSIVLERVSKDDVDRTYNLQVSNLVDKASFTVRISTMDEPAGVELEAGAIVGIVIAVLVLLIAIFLIVFAKATDRWCFAGGKRGKDHTKSSGESSDTESAVGGRGERSRLAELSARVRAALPRAKDKVQQAEHVPEAEEKQAIEEKKGVVYAELALGDQTAGDKPTPQSTEYAEIIYTNQPENQPSKEQS